MLELEQPIINGTSPLAHALTVASPVSGGAVFQPREINVDRITSSYKVMRKKVPDRWVWLVLGIILFVASVFFIVTDVHAAEPAAAASADDAIGEVVRTSGPAAGLVVLLGYFIRTWQADIRTAIVKLEARVEAATSVDHATKIEVTTLQGALGTLRAEQLGLLQRIERLERKSSGTYPKGE